MTKKLKNLRFKLRTYIRAADGKEHMIMRDVLSEALAKKYWQNTIDSYATGNPGLLRRFSYAINSDIMKHLDDSVDKSFLRIHGLSFFSKGTVRNFKHFGKSYRNMLLQPADTRLILIPLISKRWLKNRSIAKGE